MEELLTREEFVWQLKRQVLPAQLADFRKHIRQKHQRKKALRSMTNAQIDSLINDSSNIQAKNFYSSFKKNNAEKVNQ